MKFLRSSGLAAAFVLAGVSAQAATFDFDAMGDAYEADYAAFADWDAVENVLDPYLEDGGISIINMTATPDNHLAYFDGGFKNGLGACEILVSGQNSCAGNSDDNLLPIESVTITFDAVVYLTDLFVYGNHTDFGDGSIEINSVLVNIIAGVANLSGLASASSFTFVDVSLDGAYLASATVSAVPLPAAGWLLLGGLGGLAAVKRRKKVA
jgi:hypothetical protein